MTASSELKEAVGPLPLTDSSANGAAEGKGAKEAGGVEEGAADSGRGPKTITKNVVLSDGTYATQTAVVGACVLACLRLIHVACFDLCCVVQLCCVLICLCCVVLCCVVLCCAVLCRAVLCCFVLCCVVLFVVFPYNNIGAWGDESFRLRQAVFFGCFTATAFLFCFFCYDEDGFSACTCTAVGHGREWGRGFDGRGIVLSDLFWGLLYISAVFFYVPWKYGVCLTSVSLSVCPLALKASGSMALL